MTLTEKLKIFLRELRSCDYVLAKTRCRLLGCFDYLCRAGVSVQNISKSYELILMIFSIKNAYVVGTNRLAFGEDPDSFADPGSFSKFLYH